MLAAHIIFLLLKNLLALLAGSVLILLDEPLLPHRLQVTGGAARARRATTAAREEAARNTSDV